MAHLVESMMYVGELPWHKLGVQVQDTITSEEAIIQAGLDWTATLAPVYANAPGLVVAGAPLPPPTVIDGYKAVIRSSDGKALGLVGDRYRPIQNRAAFAAFDPLVQAGMLRYHTAGSLDEGRKVWILAEIPGDLVIPGDGPVKKFVLLSNSHDGSSCLRMLRTPVRVVCNNTLTIALRDGQSEGLSVRHTASAEARFKQATRQLESAVAYYQRFQDTATALVQARFSDRQMVSLSEGLFPADENGIVSGKATNAREKVQGLFAYGRGHGPIRGTAWAAYNAVAEYADHHRSTRGENKSEARASSIWFGSAGALKAEAFDHISTEIGMVA